MKNKCHCSLAVRLCCVSKPSETYGIFAISVLQFLVTVYIYITLAPVHRGWWALSITWFLTPPQHTHTSQSKLNFLMRAADLIIHGIISSRNEDCSAWKTGCSYEATAGMKVRLGYHSNHKEIQSRCTYWNSPQYDEQESSLWFPSNASVSLDLLGNAQ